MGSKYELHLGDCLDFMRGMDAGSVDLGFCDPPYNVSKDYGTYKDNMPDEEYLSWCLEWITELKRICKSVAIYPPKIHLLQFWNMLPTSHQIICAWSPEGAIRGNFVHQYIPLLVPPKPVKRTKDHWWNVQVPGLGYFYREEKFGNPGQTSMDITRRILMSFTNKEETVLDCFSGVGTTGVACMQLGRKFIGCEIDPAYFAIAEKRIKAAASQEIMF
jgi:site-specific DNA-methyltransferase (adenine-specific)